MSASVSPVGVALVGFGTVGRAVARLLAEGRHPAVVLRAVCTHRAAHARRTAPWIGRDVVWTDRFDDVLRVDVSVVVELIGNLEPARSWIARALMSGRSVVTANKQVMAEHGPALTALARACGRALRFEGSVGGVTPIVCGVEGGLAADRLTRAIGIVNGTCNFVLTRMERDHVSLDDAVADARARGFAEADPSADLDGLDARAKVVILSAVAFDHYVRPSDVPAESIRPIRPVDHANAAALGKAVRQVAWVERVTGSAPAIAARVGPALVDRRSWLASADGPRNVVVVRGERSGDTVFVGEGAGGDATAVAVVSDLLAAARGGAPTRPWPAACGGETAIDLVAPHYVRVTTRDGHHTNSPAVELERRGLRIRTVLNGDAGNGRSSAPISRSWAALLHTCSQRAVSDALASIFPADRVGCAALRLPVIET